MMDTLYELGPDAQIDPNVVLGYQYPGNDKPLVIGANAIIRCGSVIYANTRIGKRFTCGHNVVIRAECEIGDRVVLLHQVTLEGKIHIADGVKIMAHVYIPSRTIIGRFVFIGPGCNFLNAKLPMRDPTGGVVQGATIGEQACIGGGVTIGPGVTVGARSFIGAGSLVNKDVPPDTLAYGVPARHFPLPDSLAGGNVPSQLLTGTDLWDGQKGDDWKVDFPELVAQ